jgi:hypothetical protein
MNRAEIVWPVIALVVGLAGGYGIAQLVSSGDRPSPSETVAEAAINAEPMMSPSPDASSMHEADHGSSDDTSHMHGTYEVSATEAPSVSLAVVEDAKSGWNVMLTTDKFTFTPEDVNGPNVTGEGHAHLFVDGVKVARMYGPFFHYPEDFDGTRASRVTLNANDHSEYAVDGEVIEAVVDVKHEHHE